MSYVRKQAAEDGTYTVYVGRFPVRTSLSDHEADRLIRTLAYLQAPRDWSDAA